MLHKAQREREIERVSESEIALMLCHSCKSFLSFGGRGVDEYILWLSYTHEKMKISETIEFVETLEDVEIKERNTIEMQA
jgi:hypothetical protein